MDMKIARSTWCSFHQEYLCRATGRVGASRTYLSVLGVKKDNRPISLSPSDRGRQFTDILSIEPFRLRNFTPGMIALWVRAL